VIGSLASPSACPSTSRTVAGRRDAGGWYCEENDRSTQAVEHADRHDPGVSGAADQGAEIIVPPQGRDERADDVPGADEAPHFARAYRIDLLTIDETQADGCLYGQTVEDGPPRGFGARARRFRWGLPSCDTTLTPVGSAVYAMGVPISSATTIPFRRIGVAPVSFDPSSVTGPHCFLRIATAEATTPQL
jgi:hypothetical protein